MFAPSPVAGATIWGKRNKQDAQSNWLKKAESDKLCEFLIQHLEGEVDHQVR